MNPNCLYAEPGDWTQVVTVVGKAANHYTNDDGYNIVSDILPSSGATEYFNYSMAPAPGEGKMSETTL